MNINELITTINDAVWGYVLIFALVGCGVWFTIRTRFVQFRMVGEMLRLLTDSAVDTVGEQVKERSGGKSKHISSFQAFAVSVATRVGTGNLAGVASAIAIGGPGAVFWMWIIALIGSATAFVESTLAQLFKQKHKDSFIGGPAYYIQRGLHQRWMAVTFAVLITLQFGLSNNSIQANTICGAMQEAFGWSPVWVGGMLAALGLFIVFGGIQRILDYLTEKNLPGIMIDSPSLEHFEGSLTGNVKPEITQFVPGTCSFVKDIDLVLVQYGREPSKIWGCDDVPLATLICNFRFQPVEHFASNSVGGFRRAV